MLYTVYMLNLMIMTKSMIPIYEQIADQIRSMIVKGELKPQTLLPSVRTVARDCKISALTVKKAYDRLEEEGLVCSVQGKGTFVAQISPNLVQEQAQKDVEDMFSAAVEKARNIAMSDQDILELVSILLKEEM